MFGIYGYTSHSASQPSSSVRRCRCRPPSSCLYYSTTPNAHAGTVSASLLPMYACLPTQFMALAHPAAGGEIGGAQYTDTQDSLRHAC